MVDLNDYDHIERELMLAKLVAHKEDDHDLIKRVIETFKARIIDVNENLYTIEITDTGKKIDAFLTALDDQFILEVVRTGATAILLGEKIIMS